MACRLSLSAVHERLTEAPWAAFSRFGQCPNSDTSWLSCRKIADEAVEMIAADSVPATRQLAASHRGAPISSLSRNSARRPTRLSPPTWNCRLTSGRGGSALRTKTLPDTKTQGTEPRVQPLGLRKAAGSRALGAGARNANEGDAVPVAPSVGRGLPTRDVRPTWAATNDGIPSRRHSSFRMSEFGHKPTSRWTERRSPRLRSRDTDKLGAYGLGHLKTRQPTLRGTGKKKPA